MHPLNAALPYASASFELEQQVLVNAVLDGLASALSNREKFGHYDFLEAVRQIKRLVSNVLIFHCSI
jgi:hypothetical protein